MLISIIKRFLKKNIQYSEILKFSDQEAIFLLEVLDDEK